MKLRPDETLLRGNWVLAGDKVVGDETCHRIESLLASHLVRLGNDWSGWETLFADPDDKRLWERTYEHGEWHGGGPPTLRLISLEDARKKYGEDAVVFNF